MSSVSHSHPVKRRVPGWPRRWAVLFGLRDDILFDAPNLLGLWLRSRDAFWQYVMQVEERRAAREARTRDGVTETAPPTPQRGAWRIED